MKKNFKIYAIVWAIGLAIFNLTAFLIPSETRFTPNFWLGYAFITLAFILQLGTAFFAFKEEKKEKFFLNVSTINISFTTLICTAIVAAITMAVEGIPDWLGSILCFACFGIGIVSTLLAKTAGDIVSEKEEKIKAQTFFIKALTVDADTLVSQAKTPEIKAELTKVYEAIRYSDPMSNSALFDIEEQIKNEFKAFSDAVKDEDIELTIILAKNLLALLKTRNDNCKLLK